MTVLAIDTWKNNAELIADVATLGYLNGRVLDPTYGEGNFWTAWRPTELTACDLVPHKSPIGYPIDFRNMPWPSRHFNAVMFDPPYKLNGTPDEKLDERYGVHIPTRWQDRMTLILDGVVECCRLAEDYCLVKCQDQVCSGQVRWQTDDITEVAKVCGMRKVDRLDFLSYREQPKNRRQVHARRNCSTLLVFAR